MFTVMPYGASSVAKLRCNPFCPPFAATYAEKFGIPRCTASVPMLMIRPQRCFFMCGRQARVSRNGLLIKKSIIRWKNAQSYPSIGFCG